MATRAKSKKNQEQDQDLDLDHFLCQVERVDPFLLWGILRTSLLPSLSLWDILLDKSVMSVEEKHLANVPFEKLKEMFGQLDNLLGHVSTMLFDMCEETVKSEHGGSAEDDVIVLSQSLAQSVGNGIAQFKLKQEFPEQYKERFLSTVPDKEEEFDDNIDDVDEEEEEVKEEEEPTKKRKKKKEGGNFVPSKCQVCQKTFNNMRAVQRHNQKGCSGKPKENLWQKMIGGLWYCLHPDCGMPDGNVTEDSKSYLSRTIFWKHVVDAHTNEKDWVYSCESCPERFPFDTMLKFHFTQKHSKRYTCETCGATFSVRPSLIKHKRVHTGEKPYACPHCPYRSATSLVYHKKSVHADIYKPQLNMCEQCGKGFVCKDQLREHSFTHTDIKRFSCEICGRQLKNDSCYRRHMVCVHGKKLTCELCGKDYSAKLGLMQHKRKEHGIMY